MWVQNVTIIVFHSYPNKPCVDGLMSAIITSMLYSQSDIVFVPYWRTPESFERVKSAVKRADSATCHVIYVDCSPDLEQEVAFFLSILQEIKLDVYDHHPRKEDSPMKKLIGLDNFQFSFDADRCAAMMMYALLTPEQKQTLKCEKLVQIIQYSEYEGLNPRVAGYQDSLEIAKLAFEIQLKNTTPSQNKRNGNLRKVSQNDMELYYVLDHVLPQPQNWSFLYDRNLDNQAITDLFLKEMSVYIHHGNNVLNGECQSVYSEEATQNFLKLLEDMKTKLDDGKVIKGLKIETRTSNVFLVSIDIMTFGRSLELFVRKKMRETNTHYAVLMNPPRKNNKGEASHYFSLRRASEDYDARDLSKYVMSVSGSSIGGGHPWASGVTLTQEQFQKFIEATTK